MTKHLTWKNLGWILTGLVVFMLGSAGVSKVLGTEEMVKNFEFMHLTQTMMWVGLAELIGVVLLVFPKTSVYGALLISSLMSGAVAIHFSCMGGSGYGTPLVIGLLGWTAHCLRTYRMPRRK